MGGQCKERVIPFIHDVIYAFQVFAIFMISFEKFCGFGKETKEEKAEVAA